MSQSANTGFGFAAQQLFTDLHQQHATSKQHVKPIPHKRTERFGFAAQQLFTYLKSTKDRKSKRHD